MNTAMLMTPDKCKAADELHALLSPRLCRELEQHERSIVAPAGACLIQQGKLPDELVIVHSGKVELWARGLHEPFPIDCAAQGKVFGMRSVVSSELPEIDVICSTPCQATLVGRDAFLAFLKANPETYLVVAKVLSADLQIATRMLRLCFQGGAQPQLGST